jgi:hypothetical protein
VAGAWPCRTPSSNGRRARSSIGGFVIREVTLSSPRIALTDSASDALPRSESSEPSSISVALERVRVTDGRIVVAVGQGTERQLYGGDRVQLDVRPTFGGADWRAAVSELAVRPRGRPLPRCARRASSRATTAW